MVRRAVIVIDTGAGEEAREESPASPDNRPVVVARKCALFYAGGPPNTS
jgi:hypothetical protein